MREEQRRRKEFAIGASALLIIDMQEYFLNEKSHACVPAGKRITGNVARLLMLYRAHGLPVIFTYFAIVDKEDDPISRWWRDTVHEGTEQANIVSALELKEGSSEKRVMPSERAAVCVVPRYNPAPSAEGAGSLGMTQTAARLYRGTRFSEFPENELVLRKPTYDAFHRTNLESLLRDRSVSQVLITGVLTNLCVETTARSAFCRGFDVFVVADATAAYEEEMHRASLANLSYGFATILSTDDILRA